MPPKIYFYSLLKINIRTVTRSELNAVDNYVRFVGLMFGRFCLLLIQSERPQSKRVEGKDVFFENYYRHIFIILTKQEKVIIVNHHDSIEH